MEQTKGKIQPLRERLLSDDDFEPRVEEEQPKSKVVIVPTPNKVRSETNSIEPPKTATPANNATVEKESYTISDTPDAFVCGIFEGLKRLEARNRVTIGRLYVFAAAVIFTILAWMKSEFIPHLPSIEVIFVVFLTTFIINYYLINGALYKPFLDDENNSFLIKLNGGYVVAIVAAFYYSLYFITIKAAVSIFYFGLILVIILEIYILNEAYTRPQLVFAVGSFLGVLVMFIAEDFPYWSERVLEDYSGFWGVLLAIASAGMLGQMFLNFSRMYKENFASMNHIFSMMVVLFLPVFFPIEGVVKPSAGEWLLLIVMGVMNCAAILILMRSLQLENPGNVSTFLYIQPALGFLLNWITRDAFGILALFASIFTLLCVVMFARETRRKITVRDTFIHNEGQGMMEEMKEFPSESHPA